MIRPGQTFSARAVEVLRHRKTKVQSWYLDLTMIEKYWGAERVYHHTAPINMLYGLHEALVILDLLGPDDPVGVAAIDQRQVGLEHRVDEDDQHRRQVEGRQHEGERRETA